jgi:hypothetical protein
VSPILDNSKKNLRILQYFLSDYLLLKTLVSSINY